MNTLHFPSSSTSGASPRGRIRARQLRYAVLWVGVSILAAATLGTFLLLAGQAMFSDAVALQLSPGNQVTLQSWNAAAPPGDDLFYLQKLNAKTEELPAQF
jgi:hypothetical protein